MAESFPYRASSCGTMPRFCRAAAHRWSRHAQHRDAATGWLEQSRNAADRRRPAGAVWSEESEDGPVTGGEADPVDNDEFPVALAEIVDFDHQNVVAA